MPERNSAHCVDRNTRLLLSDGVTEETIENIVPMWDVYYNLLGGSATATDVLNTETCIINPSDSVEPTPLLSINGETVYPAVRFRFDNPPDCLIKLTVEDNLDPDPGDHELLLTDKHSVVVLHQRVRRQCENTPQIETLRQQLLSATDTAIAVNRRKDIGGNRDEFRTYLTAVDFETEVCVERKNGRLGKVRTIEAPEQSSMICSLILASETGRHDITERVIREAIPINMRKNLSDPACQYLPLDTNGVLAHLPFMEYFNNWYDYLLLLEHTSFDDPWTGLTPLWPPGTHLPEAVWGLTGADHAIFGNGNGNGTLTLQRMHHHRTIVDYSMAEIWRP